MIKVFYFTRANLSLRKGHVFNIVKTADALNKTSDISVRIVKSFRECFAERKDFDVLYFRDPKLFWQVPAIKYFLRKKVVFEVHGSEEWKGLSWLWRLMYRLSDGAVFITAALKNWYGESGKPSAVAFTNAPDFDTLEDNPEKIKKWKTDHGIPIGKTILLYAGSGMWYDLELLVDMMRDLPDKCALVVVGLTEKEKSSLRKYAEKRAVAGCVFLFGRFGDKERASWLFTADILLNPLKIGFSGSVSSKIYEYLAAGRPIISTRNQAMEEVLRHEVNALFVEELNAGVVRKAVLRILGDSSLGHALSKQAREDARQYTWERRGEIVGVVLRKVYESI